MTLPSAPGRREFIRTAIALGAAGPVWSLLDTGTVTSAMQSAAAAPPPLLDLAEWTNSYIGLETTMLPRGETLTGKHLYVEIFTPRQLRHPYPVILVPGGTSQGLDWIVTPDGRRGWALLLVEQGYRVYVVDKPAQGRQPYIPDVHGAFSAQAPTYEQAIRSAVLPGADGHTEWPGTGQIGDRALD